jgi:hypothetical protein
MELDRLKRAVEAVVKGVLRPLDYFALYPGKVVQQAADGLSLDVQPEDSRIPGLSGIPLRLGLPGAVVKVAPGARVLVGFENGEAARPFACLWDTASVTELVVTAAKIYLGEASGTEPAAKGQTLQTYLDGLKTAFDTHTHLVAAAPSGGPTIPTVTPLPLSPAVPDVKASRAEVK